MNLEASTNQEAVSASSGPALGPEALQKLTEELPAFATLIEKYLALQLERVQASVQEKLNGFYLAVFVILVAAGLVALGFAFLFLALAHGITTWGGSELGWGYLLSAAIILIVVPTTAKFSMNNKRRRTLLARMQKYDTSFLNKP